MLFRMGAQIVQFVLQFDDRLLEIELMFHAWNILTMFGRQSMGITGGFAAIIGFCFSCQRADFVVQ
jgi:hypothetical protein